MEDSYDDLPEQRQYSTSSVSDVDGSTTFLRAQPATTPEAHGRNVGSSRSLSLDRRLQQQQQQAPPHPETFISSSSVNQINEYASEQIVGGSDEEEDDEANVEEDDGRSDDEETFETDGTRRRVYDDGGEGDTTSSTSEEHGEHRRKKERAAPPLSPTPRTKSSGGGRVIKKRRRRSSEVEYGVGDDDEDSREDDWRKKGRRGRDQHRHLSSQARRRHRQDVGSSTDTSPVESDDDEYEPKSRLSPTKQKSKTTFSKRTNENDDDLDNVWKNTVEDADYRPPAPKKAKYQTPRPITQAQKTKNYTNYTGYTLWQISTRNRCGFSGSTILEVSRQMGQMWQTVPKSEKEEWKRKADRLKRKREEEGLESKPIAPEDLIFSDEETYSYHKKPGHHASGGPKMKSTGKKEEPSNRSGGSSSKKKGATKAIKDMTPAERREMLLSKPIPPPQIKPMDVAAHLKILGKSLSLIGERVANLQGGKKVTVHGSLSVLLDSLLCSLTPLLCMTHKVPRLKEAISEERLSEMLEQTHYIMPGV